VTATGATGFTSRLWSSAGDIYDAIVALPFNRELTAGTLDPEVFHFYIVQDSLYLVEFARALAVTGARADTPQTVLEFLQFAQGAIVVERALHEHYLVEIPGRGAAEAPARGSPEAEFGVQPGAGQSPSCAFYTNYLLATASQRSYEEAVAALLPCFWIYREVGTAIHREAAPDNPYRRWIDTYAGEEFGAAVDRAILATEAAAEQASPRARRLMVDAYLTSARLEWLFWDSAYRLERWPP
jgi:thiaminase (transcriptional activator TenA)